MCAIFQRRRANDTIIVYPRFLYFLVQGNTFLPPLLKRYENAYVQTEKDGERSLNFIGISSTLTRRVDRRFEK